MRYLISKETYEIITNFLSLQKEFTSYCGETNGEASVVSSSSKSDKITSAKINSTTTAVIIPVDQLTKSNENLVEWYAGETKTSGSESVIITKDDGLATRNSSYTCMSICELLNDMREKQIITPSTLDKCLRKLLEL